MVQKYTNEELWTAFDKIPKDVQQIILSDDAIQTIESIGRDYKLPPDKVWALKDEAGLVLLGVTHPKDFISNLSEKLGVDKEIAKKIAEDVNQQIFQKVLMSLRKIHNITDEARPSLEATEGAAGIMNQEKQKQVLPVLPKVPMPSPSVPPLLSKQPPPVLRVAPAEKAAPKSGAPAQTRIRGESLAKEPWREELRPLEIRPIAPAPKIATEAKPPAPAVPEMKIMPNPEKISPPVPSSPLGEHVELSVQDKGLRV